MFHRTIITAWSQEIRYYQCLNDSYKALQMLVFEFHFLVDLLYFSVRQHNVHLVAVFPETGDDTNSSVQLIH